MAVPFLYNDGVLTVLVDGSTKSIDSQHPNFKKVRSLLKSGTEDELVEAFKELEQTPEPSSDKVSLKDQKHGSVTISNGRLCYKGEEITNTGLTRAVFDLQLQGLPFDGMVKFIERLYENSSFRARTELFAFVERNGLTIDSEGFLVAYKAVTKDYMDKHSGTIYNAPGQVVSMDRAKVDDNCNTHCSYGLHVGSLAYIYSFGSGDDRIVIVRVDPADVVSVPTDCECRKIRCCRYEVLGDYQGELQQVCYPAEATTSDWYADDESDEDDDDFDWSECEDEDEYSDFEDEDDEELDEDDVDDDFFDEGDVTSTKSNRLGVKPSGQRYHNVRGQNGRFVRG